MSVASQSVLLHNGLPQDTQDHSYSCRIFIKTKYHWMWDSLAMSLLTDTGRWVGILFGKQDWSFSVTYSKRLTTIQDSVPFVFYSFPFIEETRPVALCFYN